MEEAYETRREISREEEGIPGGRRGGEREALENEIDQVMLCMYKYITNNPLVPTELFYKEWGK